MPGKIDICANCYFIRTHPKNAGRRVCKHTAPKPFHNVGATDTTDYRISWPEVDPNQSCCGGFAAA
jgi:hypothetical protein